MGARERAAGLARSLGCLLPLGRGAARDGERARMDLGLVLGIVGVVVGVAAIVVSVVVGLDARHSADRIERLADEAKAAAQESREASRGVMAATAELTFASRQERMLKIKGAVRTVGEVLFPDMDSRGAWTAVSQLQKALEARGGLKLTACHALLVTLTQVATGLSVAVGEQGPGDPFPKVTQRQLERLRAAVHTAWEEINQDPGAIALGPST